MAKEFHNRDVISQRSEAFYQKAFGERHRDSTYVGPTGINWEIGKPAIEPPFYSSEDRAANPCYYPNTRPGA